MTHDGYNNEIEIGWYQNGVEEGNFMIIDANDYTIKFCGFYEKGKWAQDMKDHQKY